MDDLSDEQQLTTPTPAGCTGRQVGGLSTPPVALPTDDGFTGGAQGRALPATRPPSSYVHVRRWVVEQAAGLRRLRQELRDQLSASARTTDTDADDIVLVTSELATNALAHGRSPALVQLLLDGQAVLLVVSDTDAAHAPFLAEGREPGEGGFGLQIARRLSTDVGWWSDANGKHVWATFPARPAS